MDSEFKLTAPQVPVEPMDFLSRAWCNSTVQVFQPVSQDGAMVLQDNPMNVDVKAPLPKMDKTANMGDGDLKSVPPWKSNDLKSWIWLQQAMHPEINYDRCFRKKWLPWKLFPFKNLSIKKWVKEIKQKRKEDERLQRAEVHAAISVAGVAAALAAIAAENTKHSQPNTTKEVAVASAAALVAAQCAQVAEAMGAKREQLSTVMGSAMTSTSASDIVTLTASAATSLRGASTLRARPGRRERLNGSAPVLPIEDNNDFDFDFDKFRSMVAKGAELSIETSDGVVLDLHAELYKDTLSEEAETSYYIVLSTSRGTTKLDMEDDHARYKMWAMTINHMLMLSTTFTGYELQFYRN